MSSKIKLKTLKLTSSFLDPRQEFQLKSQEFQVRFDPLTGRTGHFSHFGAIQPQPLNLAEYNDPQLKGFCPFCPEVRTKVTPKFNPDFIPEGRLAKGE